jgi:hypothetical protein
MDLAKAEAELEALARELGDVAEATNQAVTDTAELEAARQSATQQQADAEAAAGKAGEAQAQAADATDAAADAIQAATQPATPSPSIGTRQNKSARSMMTSASAAKISKHTGPPPSDSPLKHSTRRRRPRRPSKDSGNSRGLPLPPPQAMTVTLAIHARCVIACYRRLGAHRQPPKLDTARRQRNELARARDNARTDVISLPASKPLQSRAKGSAARLSLARSGRAPKRSPVSQK